MDASTIMPLVPIDVFRVARLAIGNVARPFKISFIGHIVAANPSVVTGIVLALHDFFNDIVLLVLRSHIPFPHHIKMNSTTKDNKNNLTAATRTGWGEVEAKSSSNNPTTPKISIRREGCSVVDSETSDSETTTEPNTMTHTMTLTTTHTITHNYETSDSETAARRDEKESA